MNDFKSHLEDLESMTAYERVIDALERGGSDVEERGTEDAMAQCPAHNDRIPSLHVTGTRDKVLMHCFAGCTNDEVTSALGLSTGELFDGEAATYTYLNIDGSVNRVVERSSGKDFRQHDHHGQPVILYRLPDLDAASMLGTKPVYLVEGEKDADTLAAMGVLATTAPMGARSFHLCDASPLHSMDVIAVVDRDEMGRYWAEQVQSALSNHASSLRFVQAAKGKDATDHVQAGLGLDALLPWNGDASLDAFAQEVKREAHRIRVREAAREAVAADRAGAMDLPDLTRLDAFLAVPDTEVTHRVAGLWPSGGRVVLAAQHKAGKTTLTGNLMRSLVDGEPFLDKFDPIRAERVVLLDDELDERMMRRWLRDQDVRASHAVELMSLRGRLSSFDVLSTATRSRWARHLGDADVLILDCLRPALDALGLSEDKEAGRFLEAMDELLAEAGIGELFVVHHMGHTNERSRGDSRLLDWPDAVWKLVREDIDDPMSPRYFSAYGRDVDQAEVRLAFNPLDRRLLIDGGSRRDIKLSGMREAIAAHVEANPGCSQTAIEDAITGDRVLVRKAVKAMCAERLLQRVKDGSTHRHYPAGTE